MKFNRITLRLETKQLQREFRSFLVSKVEDRIKVLTAFQLALGVFALMSLKSGWPGSKAQMTINLVNNALCINALFTKRFCKIDFFVNILPAL